MNLRFLIVPLIVILFSGLGFSQKDNSVTFEVTNASSKGLKNKYIEAFSSADFNNYRMIDQKRELVFLDGTRVILSSANEVGASINKERYPKNKVYPNKFKLHDSGIIIELHESPKKKKSNTNK